MIDPRSPSSTHLTEAERHGAADGTLAPELVSAVGQHMEACDACANDVARIKAFMTRTLDVPAVIEEVANDAWPLIRARIQHEKIARIPVARRPSTVAGRRVAWVAGGVVAASLLAVLIVRRNAAPTSAPTDGTPMATSWTAVAESTHVYEEQIKFLLNELELRRALMRPQTASPANHDLEVIDGAIAELKRAIERDPKNIALRALLAQSYKQKVDLLKRIANAG
jgi:hypothetical protein